MKELRRLAETISHYEVIPIAAMILLATADESLLPAALAVIFAFTLLRWAVRGQIVPRTPLNYPLLGLLIMAGVSLLITPTPQISLVHALRLACGIGLFYALVSFTRSRQHAAILLMGAAVLALLTALAALVSVDWVTNKLRYLDFAFLRQLPDLVAERVHPNVMAGALAILFPFPVALALFGRRWIGWAGRLFLLLGSGFVVGVIVLTESRGAMIAALAALYLLIWLRSAWAGGAVTLLGLGVFGYLYWQGFDFQHAYYSLVMAGGDTLGLRVRIWQRALLMIRDFPFTGVGLGAFTDVMNNFYPLSATPAVETHAHQIFLQVAVDLGLPGLVAWTAALGAEVVCGIRLFGAGRNRSGVSALWRAGGAAMLASLTALVVHGLADAVTWGTRVEVITWGIWGIGAGVWALYSMKGDRRNLSRGS